MTEKTLQLFEPDETPQEDSTAQNLPDIPEPERPQPSPPSFIPPPTHSGRARKFPVLFKDFLPNSTSRIPLPHMPPRPPRSVTLPAPVHSEPPVVLPVNAKELTPVDFSFTTEPDEFGLF